MSLTKCCLVTLSAGALALLVPGCGLPPCVEGTIQIEVLELQPESTCLWELWPADATIIAKTDHNVGLSGDCHAQWLENQDPPMNQAPRATEVSRAGVRIAVLPGIDYTFDECEIFTNGIVLAINRRYDDFEAALAGQRTGDSDAFFVEVSYVTDDECADYPFEQARPSQSKGCGNTYRARVTKL